MLTNYSVQINPDSVYELVNDDTRDFEVTINFGDFTLEGTYDNFSETIENIDITHNKTGDYIFIEYDKFLDHVVLTNPSDENTVTARELVSAVCDNMSDFVSAEIENYYDEIRMEQELSSVEATGRV